jgi:hypothetical protein
MRGSFFKKLSKLPRRVIESALIDIEAVMASRPLGGVTSLELDGEAPTVLAITPSVLADGVRNSFSNTPPPYIGAGPPSTAMKNARKWYKNVILKELKKKSAQEVARKAQAGGVSPFRPGAPCLLMRQSVGKHDYGYVLAHILSRAGKPGSGLYKLVAHEGRSDNRIVTEHHFNLIPLLAEEIEFCYQLPDQVGRRIRVYARTGKKKYDMVICQQFRSGRCRALLGEVHKQGNAATRVVEYSGKWFLVEP